MYTNKNVIASSSNGRNAKRQRSKSIKSNSNPFASGYIPSIPKVRMMNSFNNRSGGYVGLEVKFKDFSKGSTNLDYRLSAANHSPGTEGCLNAIATGDGPSERDGRKCTLKSLHINGAMFFAPGAGTAHAQAQARLLIVVDTQTNKQQLTNLGEVLHNSTNANEEENHVYLFRELASTKRFKILYDKTYVFNPGEKGLAVQKNFKININLKDMIVNYDNGTSSNGHVNTIYDNAIYLFALSDMSTTATEKVKLEYVSRVRFVG